MIAINFCFIYLFFTAVECLDTKRNEPGENVIKPENNNSGNTKSTDNSDTCLEICPPFFKENNQDSSTVNKSETSLSIIPEPPSSPSLVSLPDEEEFTPSLGLEGDGDDDDDDDDDDEEEEEVIIIINFYQFTVVEVEALV